MRDKNSHDSSASVGADANAGCSGVDYQVLNLHAAIKQELHCTGSKCSGKGRECLNVVECGEDVEELLARRTLARLTRLSPFEINSVGSYKHVKLLRVSKRAGRLPLLYCFALPSESSASITTNAFKKLSSALRSKQHLLGTKGSIDADESWQVSWTSNDSQSFLKAVQAVADNLPSSAQADAREDVAEVVVKAAADLSVQDLCQLALTIRHSWELLPRQHKQLDHAPLEIVCAVGLLLCRLYPCTRACTAGGPLQQQALALLRQICSSTAQQLLHESIAGHVFIFRWHEQQQQQHGQLHAADDSIHPAGFIPQYRPACSHSNRNNSRSAVPAVGSVLGAGNSRRQLSAQSCEVHVSNPAALTLTKTTVDTKPLAAQAATPAAPADGTQPQCGPGHYTNALPRLVSAGHVPHAHCKWIGRFQLPVIPTTMHWAAAQEVLLGWNDITNDKITLEKAKGLDLDSVIGPDVFMLAVEALWLFTQSSDGFIKPQLPAAAAAAGPCADTVLPPPPAAAVISGDQRAELWSSLLVRLIFIMEAHKSAAAATADTAAGSGIQQAAAAVRSDLITPASNVLLSTLAECLMSMTDLWQQQPAAARAALIRSVISGSDQSVITRQKKISQLLGKAKPKGLEVVISRLLLLVTHLAAVLVELLQLERTLCGGPRRDGTVPITAAGEEPPWFSCLWKSSPISMSQVLELLLRCPTPFYDDIKTLIELLMDDLWEALRVVPLLEPDNNGFGVNDSVSNTAVGTSQTKCHLQPREDTKMGWGMGCCRAQQQQQQPSLGPDLINPIMQGNLVAAAAAVVGQCSNTSTYDIAVSTAVTAAIVTTQKAIRSWQAAISQVLLLPAAAAAAQSAHGGTSVNFVRNKVSGTTVARKTTDAARLLLQNDAAAADNAAAAPSWMLAAAAADPGAAVGFMLTLLNRGLDCAQKAYYWRWYVWWQQQQQQKRGGDTACKAATAEEGTVALGSSPDSSTGSSSSSSDDSSGLHMEDWCGSSGSFLSSSSNSGDACEAVTDADATSDTLLPAAAAAESSSCSSRKSDDPSASLNTALWGNAAVHHALGFTALAGPAFGFINSVIKIGYKKLPEAQRTRNAESALALLESVSVGLQSNTLILVELNRRLLLPDFEAAAAAGWMKSTLDTMLAKALTAAAAAAAAPQGDHVVTKKGSGGPSRPAKSSIAAAAAAATDSIGAAAAAAAAAVIIPPASTASLDDYDRYWSQLSFDPIDQLTLSKAAAELLQSASLNRKPSLLSPIGCHNPHCYNMSGFSESQLKTLTCRACRQVGYCSRACQRLHWKAHKLECQRWQQQDDSEWVDVFSEDFAEMLED